LFGNEFKRVKTVSYFDINTGVIGELSQPGYIIYRDSNNGRD